MTGRMAGTTTGRLFCFGLGYSARALAAALSGEGFNIAGTVREEDAAVKLRREGFEVHVFSRERPLDRKVAPTRRFHASHNCPIG